MGVLRRPPPERKLSRRRLVADAAAVAQPVTNPVPALLGRAPSRKAARASSSSCRTRQRASTSRTCPHLQAHGGPWRAMRRHARLPRQMHQLGSRRRWVDGAVANPAPRNAHRANLGPAVRLALQHCWEQGAIRRTEVSPLSTIARVLLEQSTIEGRHGRYSSVR